MKQEKSCGVIPYIVINNEIRFVLVKQNNGFICFPKGHVEEGETERDTALRELKEETGLTVDLLEGFREVVSYYMPDYDAVKDVVFFVGKINSLNYQIQEEEIQNIIVVSYNEAYQLLEYDNWQELLAKANDYLNKNL